MQCDKGMYSAGACAGTEEWSKWIGIPGKLAMNWIIKPSHKALPSTRQIHLQDPHDQAADRAFVICSNVRESHIMRTTLSSAS